MGHKARSKTPPNELLAARVRDALEDLGLRGIEKRMFGGIAFMIGGHMTVGILGNELMARVGPGAYADALSDADARVMDFTGRPLRGYVYVAARGLDSDARLRRWVERCAAFTATLPPRA